jgi:hypothetical protein
MDIIPDNLAAAAQSARQRLTGYAREAAVAPARGGPFAQAAMAHVAQGAIFADALLSAMHARLEELKIAAK